MPPCELGGVAKPGKICRPEDAYRQVKSRLDPRLSDLRLAARPRLWRRNDIPL